MAAFAEPLRASRAATPPKPALAWNAGPARFLHAALLATAFLVFAYPIALRSGLAAGSVGAIAGTFLAEHLIARRYRLWAIAALAASLVLIGALVVWLVVDETIFPEMFSPVTALEAAECVRWCAVALGAAIALRSAALRYRAALAIEGGVVVLAVATTVAAHRDGMIARPLEVSDWFWTQGIDPVLAFLTIGLFGGVLLAGVLAYGRSVRRTLFQLVFVFLLGLILMVRIHGADADQPKKNPSGAQLDGQKDDRSGGNNGGGAGGKGDKQQQKDDPLPSPNDQKNQQNRPAAIVVFHKDVVPAAGVFYFRHAAFSQYNGVRLIESTRGDVDEDAVRTFPSARQEVPGTLKDGAGRTLVATDVALLTDHNRMFTLTDATEVSPMPNPEPARFRRAYHVVSSVIVDSYQNLLGAPSGDPDWSDEVWTHYTELPKDKRYRELAADLKASIRREYAGDPLAEAMVVKQYLEKNATYSFSRNYEGTEDPTAAFLFSEDKKGYCVHLAHAATYLLRAMGVPARVSAGYAVPATNLGGGSALLIKSGDSHAWAEIYLQDVGWVPIEVTPEKTDVKPQPFREKDLQQLFGEMARKEGKESQAGYNGPTLGELLKTLFRWLGEAVPKALVAALIIAYLMKLYRLFVAPSLAKDEKKPRIVYRAGLDRLAAVGITRTRGEPRERFAERVRGSAPSFEPLTQVHVGYALGSQVMRAGLKDGRGRLVSLPFQVGREIRESVPWWLWLLGALNPVSWMFSR